MRKLIQNRAALGLIGFALLGNACQDSGDGTKRTITFVDENKYSGSLDSEGKPGKDPSTDETTIPAKGGNSNNGKAPADGDGQQPIVDQPMEQPKPIVDPPPPTTPVIPVIPEAPKPETKNPLQVIANGQYRIQGVGSRLCLQPRDKVKTGGAEIVQFACSTENAQRFQLTFTGDKYYQITNVNSTLSLEIRDGVVVNQARVVQGSYTNSAHQHFSIEKSGTEGIYILKPRLNNTFCLDVSYASLDDNAFIQVWNQCTLANQQWTILPVN